MTFVCLWVRKEIMSIESMPSTERKPSKVSEPFPKRKPFKRSEPKRKRKPMK